MGLTEEHRKEVEREILEVIIEGLERNKINVDDLPHIAKFVLSTVDKAKSNEDLQQHLEDIVQKWPIFDHPRVNKHKKRVSLDKKA